MLLNPLVLKASLVRRVFAALVDYALLYGCIYAFVFIVAEPDPDGIYRATGAAALVGMAVALVFWLVLLPGMEATFRQTIGKMVFGVQVAKSSRREPGFLDALKRHLVDPIDFSMFGLPAFIAISNTKDKQRLGDLWAKTVVIAVVKTPCPECAALVTLEGRDILGRQYTCPECSTAVHLDA